jgi:hypothetical protein
VNNRLFTTIKRVDAIDIVKLFTIFFLAVQKYGE